MKQTERIQTIKLSALFSSFLILFSLLATFTTQAQTGKSCVVGKFEFKVQQNQVFFEAQGKGPVIAYQWNFGDGSSATGQKTRHKYAAPGVYKVCLTLVGFDSTTKKRCTFDVCRAVTIACDLKAGFELKSSGNNVNVLAKSNNRHVVFAWNFGDGSGARGQKATHTYAKPGKYEVCMTAKDTVTGCVVRECKKLEIKDPCSDFKAEIAYKQKGNAFVFTLRSKKGNGVRTLWRFSDGDSAKGNAVRKVFDSPGTYKVCATAIHPRTKCKITVCERVVVKDTCTLRAEMDFRLNGYELKAAAKSNSRNVVYGWTFGDRSAERGNPVSHTYTRPGVYELCLIALDTVTKCRVEICRKVEVRDTCSLKAEFKVRTDSNGVTYFYAWSNDSNASFTWDFGDGSSAGGNPVRHQYKPGKYTVCMIAYTSRTCVVRKCQTILVGTKGRSHKFEIPVSDEDYSYGDANASASRMNWEWDNSHVTIAPNPVSGAARLYSDHISIQHAAIFSMDGVQILGMDIQAGQSLDLGELPRGTYYVRITGAQGEIEHLRFFKN